MIVVYGTGVEVEYKYATTRTIKMDQTVAPPGEVVIPYTGKLKQEEYIMFQWGTKIYIP
jgi:hypothetical protein